MRNTILVMMTLLSFFVQGSEEKTEPNKIEPKNELVKSIELIQKPEIIVNIKEPTNWYMLSLPFITISLVIGSTIISIRTINIKTEEAKDSFAKSLETQKEISETQVRMTILSESRQKWINTLRDELSSFISKLHEIEHMLDTDKGNKTKKEDHDYLTKLLSQIELKASKITLLVNPSEDDHIKLIDLINDALINHGKGLTDLYKISDDIIILSQKILKDEWEVVKKLK
ncbi:hypothetical protein [Pseudoalteromonas sp. SWXJZ10B]|uniref:hypothetical protein n=1 Tax=Pseudoalteromonas sp. SWXJZ10B TaxID=2792063 RepID=UPI0018CF658C|nr:hypothetical protein [Pseudoalteromonas sp. SWXJZ10B]MBH0042223.1 hypothetical protein [Pseudoalteromonas sp. SWXJZ10B]